MGKQVGKIILPSKSSAPASPTAGQIYYDTTNNLGYIYNGSSWIALQNAPLASPTFTGTPAAPTAAVDTNTTQLATTAFVLAQSASATPLQAGTAAVGTSTRYARGDHIHPAVTRAGLSTSLLQTGTGTFNGSTNVTATFAQAFADANYRVFLNATSQTIPTPGYSIVSKAAGSFVCVSSVGNTDTFDYLAIHD